MPSTKVNRVLGVLTCSPWGMQRHTEQTSTSRACGELSFITPMQQASVMEPANTSSARVCWAHAGACQTGCALELPGGWLLICARRRPRRSEPRQQRHHSEAGEVLRSVRYSRHILRPDPQAASRVTSSQRRDPWQASAGVCLDLQMLLQLSPAFIAFRRGIQGTAPCIPAVGGSASTPRFGTVG